ncbi:hypothetical protein [Ligilactobacillus ruminis]|nr:hypothetical protein [Ligilactobacillus ruminis]SFG38525.1 hypothetical protein SAMN02910432_01155 [Ligilactobacillus ruminis DSM 20403 = NBRC 102161]
MRIPAGRKTDERIATEVLKYMALQKLPELCTWQDVANALMLERIGEQKEEVRKALLEKEKAEGEIREYFDELDADNEKLKLRIEELMQRNTRLEAEVNGLRTRLSSSGQVPVLFGGKETDLYPGEISEMVLDAGATGSSGPVAKGTAPTSTATSCSPTAMRTCAGSGRRRSSGSSPATASTTSLPITVTPATSGRSRRPEATGAKAQTSRQTLMRR